MRCVSYTRATCCHPFYEPAKTIAEQDILIQNYVENRGWQLQSKFYDDSGKDGINEFRRMKDEGIKGQFDCLIFYSIKQAAKDVFQIVRLLRNSFYPAGIAFVVVEDDFFSKDHTEEEVLAYLRKKESRYHFLTIENKVEPYFLKKHINTFGYRYDEDNNCIKYDEETASTVREIYRLAEKGVKPSEIAKELSKKNAETPADYQCRINGVSRQIDYQEWRNYTVFHILKNKKYIGQWGKILDKYDVLIDCPPIVSKSTFDHVQEILGKRMKAKPGPKKFVANPLYNVPLRDKESQFVLKRIKSIAKNTYHIQFQYPKEKDMVYEKKRIYYEEFLLMVEKIMKTEKRRYYQVIEHIQSPEHMALVEKTLEEIQSERKAVLSDIFKSESERIIDQKICCQEDISENITSEKEQEHNKIFNDCSDRLDRIIERVKEVKKTYSEKNPWIVLMSKYDETKDITEQKLRFFISKIDVYRFESLEISFKEQQWRDRLPQEWLEV